MPLDDPKWVGFRNELLRLSAAGDHGWLESDEIQMILRAAYRKGLDTSLILSCHAAAASTREFANELDRLVRNTKVRVLVIDDEPAFVNLLSLNLEKTGRFTVRGESDPATWRAAVAAFHPHLLILDMMMPGIDGREILAALRADEATRGLPVIVLTAVLENSRTDAVNREGILFLAKPVSLKALLHCIDEHLAAAGLQ
jgi:CheY-like chemotaxis protein